MELELSCLFSKEFIIINQIFIFYFDKQGPFLRIDFLQNRHTYEEQLKI